MSKEKTEFNRKFEALLKDRNISFRKAGSLLDMDHTKVYRWCHSSEPNVTELRRIIEVFELPDNYFK